MQAPKIQTFSDSTALAESLCAHRYRYCRHIQAIRIGEDGQPLAESNGEDDGEAETPCIAVRFAILEGEGEDWRLVAILEASPEVSADACLDCLAIYSRYAASRAGAGLAGPSLAADRN